MKDFFYSFGIIATFAIGAWNIIRNYRISKKTTFINTVTNERIKWMEKLRNNISEFCGLSYTWCISELGNSDKGQEAIEKIDQLRHLIRLQLNPRDEHDKKIEVLIADIPNFTDKSKKEKLKEKIDELIKESQELLKLEWERVKEESRRGDLKENEQFFDSVFSRINDWAMNKFIKKNRG